MGNAQIISTLRQNIDDLIGRFDVASLSVFGSVARNEQHEQSDVDILVCFRGPARFRNYFALKHHLEAILGRDVDLVTEHAVRSELRPYIDRDRINVA